MQGIDADADSERGAKPCARGPTGRPGVRCGRPLPIRPGSRSDADITPRKSTCKALDPYVQEHFPNAAHGVYPVENDSKIAIIIVGTKYSPKNYWFVSIRSTSRKRASR